MTLRNFSSTAAQTTLSAGITAASTTLTVAATTGFPPPPFILAVNAGASAQELVLVTAVAGTNLTVTRGYDSTVASAHDAGAVIQHSHAALDFREANTHVNATSAVHGVAGSLVGTTDTQTLTGKTLALGSNTVSGTKAQFNAAMTDDDFATLTGAEALTNKTLTDPTNVFPPAHPRGVLGYAQVTANQGSITTEVDLTGLTSAVTVGASRRVKITAWVSVTASNGGDRVALSIKEGATTLMTRAFVVATAGNAEHIGFPVVLSPTTGAHTYKLAMERASGTGSMTMQAGATQPAFILVEDIGAA